MEHVEDPYLLLGCESAGVSAPFWPRLGRGGASAVLAVVGGTAHAESGACLDASDQPAELFKGLVAGGVERHGRELGFGHWFFSPFRVGTLSVANWSSSAESFPGPR